MTYEKKTWEELMESRTVGQRRYLSLRVMDMPVKKAIVLAKRKEVTLENWERDEDFRDLEGYLIAHKEEYRSQAFNQYMYELGAKAQMVIEDLVEKGLDWDNQKQNDKTYIMRAVELIAKQQPSGRKTDDIEALILRRHKEG